jgi:cyclopropane fatty-acyl-phospholipid synthase-like methyltransferase
MSTTSSAETAAYYDKNTGRFIGKRKQGNTGTIHRALYAPGVKNREQALHYCHTLVLEELQRANARRVLDLGCGVGATLQYLSGRYPDAGYRGITISPVQKELAASLGLPVDQGDYHEPGWFKSQPSFDFVYAVESLQHASNLPAVIDNIAVACRNGGHFLVIDDFQADCPVPRGMDKIITRYTKHWHADGYGRRDNFIRTMETSGFRLDYSNDLSAFQRSRPFFNLAFYWLLTPLQLLDPVPSYAQNLLGGNALLRLQDLGLSEYHLLVFSRPSS